MRILRTGALTCCLCGASAAMVFVAPAAGPIPALDVAQLVEEADMIAVGTVTAVSEVGRTTLDTATSAGRVSARVLAGVMRVDQVLKGPPDLRTMHFRFYRPDERIGYREVAPSSYRVLFTRRVGDHHEFVSPYDPSVVAVPGPRIQGQSPLDRVAMAVGAVLQSQASPIEKKHEAIYALRYTKGDASLAALKLGILDNDRGVRLNAASALLAKGDITALSMAEETLLMPQPGIPPHILHNLEAGISQGMSGEATIPNLERLLLAGTVATRRAASRALGRTTSVEALIPLVWALDDADLEVRFNAVRGLAQITGRNAWGPSWDAFVGGHDRFVAYWKNWARRR